MIRVPEAVDQTNAAVRESLNGVSGFGEMTAHLSGAVGKGLRTLVFLTAAANAENYVPENAVKAAAAIELLHTATLVHDDIIDDAATRRGIETVQRKFGAHDAVICGDYLLCMSLSMLTESYSASANNGKTEVVNTLVPMITRFSKALGDICRGEYLQNRNSGNLDLGFYSYLKIISGKTAALFYISACAGGILGSENEENSHAIGRFGHYLGLAFQILDDCKDYELTETEALKPVGKDIAGGVVTLPLILAMQTEPALRSLAKEAIRSGREIPKLIEAVRKAGGTEASRRIARRYARKAESMLKDISAEKRRNLTNVLERILAPVDGK
ncbi:MAG: polyprenyl synthetase family protein [Oscillospiraceae bacterium]|nr:polyprenyl synthetase family protein [Oscillospiraceae bacterium]